MTESIQPTTPPGEQPRLSSQQILDQLQVKVQELKEAYKRKDQTKIQQTITEINSMNDNFQKSNVSPEEKEIINKTFQLATMFISLSQLRNP